MSTTVPFRHRVLAGIAAPVQRTAGGLGFAVVLSFVAAAHLVVRGGEFEVDLPVGVRVWDLGKAYRETTASRERIGLNGLWRWQPAVSKANQVPNGAWGFFKVPGCWPGITDYMQKESQTVLAHPDWKGVSMAGLSAAWYEREFSVPVGWSGRRITLQIEYLNSFASVFVDGVPAGEVHFPGGELDLTSACQPGKTHRLSLLVVALPLKGVLVSYTDSASAREVVGKVPRRGLCGDVFLVSRPAGARIVESSVDTSVRRRELTVHAVLGGLETNGSYVLRSRVLKDASPIREPASRRFRGGELEGGRLTLTESWMPDRLWDIHTPQNTFELELTLADADGRALDTDWRRRFGFREFWIDGRDFYLNGKRIFLSAVPLDNAQISAGLATYGAARESLERLKRIGINYVYTHNYDCEPGSHLSFSEILRAADDVGMLVGFTQPHFSHYEWKSTDADATNGYARHAAFYARTAENHPSVVMYVMSHNATGYDEDMNPDLIGGPEVRRDQWGQKNVGLALRAEAIVRRLDPRRIIYHHASGNLGVMHDSNFYPNFAPVQELDDWFEPWATQGVKPAFTCEYGAPFTWDWTMYRGWYKGQREWGSAKVPWEFCLAEWNAEFIGDEAYLISKAEKEDLRWEAGQFRAGKTWHRWDYPNPVGSDRFDERYPIFAHYLTNNWRAYRTWGVSGISPWEYEHFWKLRPGVDKGRKELPTDWDALQRPGFSPDFIEQRYERLDLAFDESDWIATPAAQALLRNNRPLLACLAGKTGAFTSKDHNFQTGETVEKQIIVINSSREPVPCDLRWWIDLPQTKTGESQVVVPAGEQVRIPLKFELPDPFGVGRHELHLFAKFGNGETQEDRFTIDVMPRVLNGAVPASGLKAALFDPQGETARWLESIGFAARRISAEADLSPFDLLLIGKGALTVDGPAPDIRRVRDGLKVVVFEQTADALEKRLGFRVQERGLRQVFTRVPLHHALDLVRDANLRDWRGAATLTPSRLNYELRPRYGPTIERAGLRVPRVWRCGNRGNVASVLIEKPARGDFLSIIDGGFSLQYSPLLEYREGMGAVLFCQLDVTGRTEEDPAAALLARNILAHAANWKPAPRRRAVYVGDPAGGTFLESLGVEMQAYHRDLSAEEVLVAGPGCGKSLAGDSTTLADFIKSGGRVLAVGLDSVDLGALPLFKVTFTRSEHISSFFQPFATGSLLAGIGPADVHNRDPRELPLVTAGAEAVGDGVVAMVLNSNVVFLQMAPWRFEKSDQPNLRRTFRHVSRTANRLLANLGVAGSTPLLERFSRPVKTAGAEERWLDGLYLDQPQEWDDPYRFFRW